MRRPINSVNGTYKDPNRQYSAQDALNVIPMMAEKSGTRTLSKYVDAPGLKPFCRIGTNDGETFTAADAGRGLRVVDGKLYVVAGRNLWQITAAGVSVNYGTIPGVGRVSMAHNQRGLGNELAIDNGQSRYIFNTQTQDLSKVTDESFPGSVKAFFIDGYIGYVEPGGRYWGHSDLSNALVYNAFDVYEAEGQPDRIVSAHVSNREVLIAGQDSIEAYVNAPSGSGEAPFVRATNTVIPSGCSARDSFCNVGQFTVYLDQNRTVQVLNGYTPVPISTSVIDAALQECTKQQIANAYAFSLEAEGFQIYYLTVPGKFTFGYDFKNREWHRRSSTGLAWWAVTDVVRWNGKWYALDSRRGDILELRWRDYPFDVQEELVREWVTGVVSADQNPVFIHELELLFGCGGKEYTPVGFAEQPVGPQVSGEAPNAVTGDPYTFTYTTVAGDAPIARTVLLDTVLPAGWSWNNSTATLSAANPAAETTITLRMRVFDENGLYDDHEDSLIVSKQYQLLVTGSAIGGGPVWARANNADGATFTGIATGTGADLAVGIPAFHGGTFAVVATDAARVSNDGLTSSSTISLDSDGAAMRYLVGDDNGWIAKPVNGTNVLLTSDHPPTAFAQVTPSATMTNGSDGSSLLLASDAAFFAGGKYYLNEGRTLFQAEEPNGPWVAVWDQYKSDAQGQPPGGASIQAFMDGVEIDGELYCTTAWHFDEGMREYRIQKSTGISSAWPSDGVLYSRTRASGGPWPVQMVVLPDETIVALCYGGGVLTNASGEFEYHATGLAGPATLPGPEEIEGGRRIVSAGFRIYVLGAGADAGKVVYSDDRGVTWSASMTLPISSGRGIAAGEV